MRGGWDALQETHALFEYARATWRTERPLRMAGFDGERPPHGSSDFQQAIAHLDERLEGLELDDWARDGVRDFADRTHGYMTSEPPAIEPDERAAQRELIASFADALETPEARRRLAPVERGFYAVALETALVGEEGDHRRHHGPHEGLVQLRDRQMARAFRWLAQERFPGRRIIVWAATAHLTRNTNTLVPVDRDWDYRDAEHMGDTVHADFGADLYTIAVTSHHGTIGRLWPPGAGRESRVDEIDPPLAGSFEDLAHRAGLERAFVDLRGRGEGHWLKETFVARPLGLIPTRARWSEVVDAFLFLDEMTPETTRPR